MACAGVSSGWQLNSEFGSESRFLEEMLDQLPFPVFFRDMTGVYRVCNRAFADLVCLPPAEIVGRTTIDVIPVGWVELFADHDGAIAETESPGTYEAVLNMPGAMPRAVLCCTALFRDLQGAEAGVVGAILDISDRKRHEISVGLAEERLQSLVSLYGRSASSAKDLQNFALDEALRLTKSRVGFIGHLSADGASVELQSWSRDSAGGARPEVDPVRIDVVKAGEWADAVRSAQPVMVNSYDVSHAGDWGYPAGDQPLSRFICVPTVADGRVVMVIMVANKPDDYDSSDLLQVNLLATTIWQVLLHKRDAERHEQLETQLRESHKLEAVGRLAAGVAHELNTPIQFIGDNLQYLQSSFANLLTVIAAASRLRHASAVDVAAAVTAFDEAAASADLEFLRDDLPSAVTQSVEGIQRVAAIVRALKDFSHPGVVSKIAVDVNKALAAAVAVSRNEWKYVSTVSTEFAADLPVVMAIPGEVNQVFLNLIVNAAHAIEERLRSQPAPPGIITISTCVSGDRVCVAIADNGAGIPEAIRSRVFDPFFTTKEVGKGTGQGLSIAYSVVVKRHGGELRFDSVVGQGTTFFVTLPVVAE